MQISIAMADGLPKVQSYIEIGYVTIEQSQHETLLAYFFHSGLQIHLVRFRGNWLAEKMMMDAGQFKRIYKSVVKEPVRKRRQTARSR